MNYMIPSYSMTIAPKTMFSSLTSTSIGLSSIPPTSGGIIASSGNTQHISLPTSSSSNNEGQQNFNSSKSSNNEDLRKFNSSSTSSSGGQQNFKPSSFSSSGGPRNFGCEICQKTFPRQGNLDRHRKTHNGDRPFSCDLCPKAFSQRSHLKVHRNTHTGEQSFKCHICSYCFSRNGNLTRHMRTHQRQEVFANENSYTHNGCNESSSKTDGKTQFRTVETTKPDQHSHPPHQAKTDQLHSHQTKPDHHSHHPHQNNPHHKHHHHNHHKHQTQQQQQQQQTYKCKICNKSYVPERPRSGSTIYCDICWQAMVDNHAKTHSQHSNFHTGHDHDHPSHYDHPTKSKKRLISAAAAAAALHKYQCQLCGRTFPRNGNLERHKSAHLGLKPFSCEICGRMFGQKSHAKVHMMTHTGERPYKCDVCGFAFSRNGNLARHKLYNRFSCLVPGTHQEQPSHPLVADNGTILPPPPLPPLSQLPRPSTPPPTSQIESHASTNPPPGQLPLNVLHASPQNANTICRPGEGVIVVQVGVEAQQLETVSNVQIISGGNPDNAVDQVDSNILNTPQMPNSTGE